ncbi:MAG: hypothetical protein AABO41_07890 [Acidobacteriota bacterium]
MCTILLGSAGSLDLIVIVFDFGPATFPVSTFTLMTPALPGRRTFGKSTAVHPQLGATDSMFKSPLPVFLTTRLRTSDLPCLTLPKSMLLTGRLSLGAVALETGWIAIAGFVFAPDFVCGCASCLSSGRPGGDCGRSASGFGAAGDAFGAAEAVALAFGLLGALGGVLASLAPEEQPVINAVKKMGTRKRVFMRSVICG